MSVLSLSCGLFKAASDNAPGKKEGRKEDMEAGSKEGDEEGKGGRRKAGREGERN